MAKSRSFSIYLLKQNYNAENSLKEDHKSYHLPEEANFYIKSGVMIVQELSNLLKH